MHHAPGHEPIGVVTPTRIGPSARHPIAPVHGDGFAKGGGRAGGHPVRTGRQHLGGALQRQSRKENRLKQRDMDIPASGTILPGEFFHHQHQRFEICSFATQVLR